MIMSATKLLFLWSTLLAELIGWSVSFSIAPGLRSVPPTASSTCLSSQKSHSEFSLVNEEGEGVDLPSDVAGSDFAVVRQKQFHDEELMDSQTAQTTRTTDVASNQKKPEYGAMSPGTVVQVQIGDISLARKAWKKRRRTGSPLLVPCSVLNVDHRSMVRWNLIFLLEKFGKSRPDGIEIAGMELSKKYRSFLKSSMQKQSDMLGYESKEEMISDLFNKKVQESYGIRLVEKADGQLVLKAPMSRTKAQKRAGRTPLLQFRAPKTEDYGDIDTLTHTGFLRTRKLDQEPGDRSYSFVPLSAALRVSQKDDVDSGRVEEGSVHPAVVFDYDLVGDAGSPLLTLSLNPRGVRENLKVKPDRKYETVENPKLVLQDLRVGDGPFRAKVVRLQYQRALVDMDVGRKLSSEGIVKVLGNLPFQDSVEVVGNNSHERISMDEFQNDEDDYDYGYDDDDLESPLFDFDDEDDEEEGSEEGLADELLSFRGSSSFEDGTFEEGEKEEDISNLYELNEDGSLSYTDPETGRTSVMESSEEKYRMGEDHDEDEDDEQDITSIADDNDEDIDFDMSTLFQKGQDGTVVFIDPDSGETLQVDDSDEEYEDMMAIKSLIDQYSRPPVPNNIDYTYSEEDLEVEMEDLIDRPAPKLVSKRLRVGEEVDVYIRSVSKQSGQFTVSMNPTVQGRKFKDLKKENDARKKLDRLKKSLGGSLEKIWELEGQECCGIVKATSNSGEWVYVQPELAELPVGVATARQGTDHAAFAAGDSVRVRIAGVDEQRGQLAMELLGKSGP